MKQKTMNVLFFILKNRTLKNGEAPVLMRVTIDGQCEETRIKRTILVDKWDPKTGQATGNDRKAKELNEYIRTLHAEALELYRVLLKENVFITPTVILSKMFRTEKQITVLSAFRGHIEELRMQIGKGYSYVTVNRYDNCYNALETVVKKHYKKSDISFSELDTAFIRQVELYLKVKKTLCQNTLVRYMKCIKRMCNVARQNGWLKTDPFAGLKFKQPQTNPVFLTMEELETIMNKQFTIERLEIVKDIFVFCAYTGLAFIDVSNLRADHIVVDNNGEWWIRKCREKTNIMCNIPLLDIPISILKKYKKHPLCKEKGILLPVLCNQKVNSYLKEIADLCGIKKHLSTHAARHTFATTITLAHGVALSNVSKMLGHTSTRMTEHYARVLDSSINQEMRSLQSKMRTNMKSKDSNGNLLSVS